MKCPKCDKELIEDYLFLCIPVIEYTCSCGYVKEFKNQIKKVVIDESNLLG